jgi:acyl-CoA thioesterase YciA
MKKNTSEPVGELVLRTLAMPADTNPQGDIFGGWIMAQMDIAGGIMANEIARSRVVTVAVESINFIKPVHVGDVVGCYGKVIRIGKTSITINLEVWVKPAQSRITEEVHMLKVTEAAFTYVAVDPDGKKQPVLRDRVSVL